MSTISGADLSEDLRGLAEQLDLDLDGVDITDSSALEDDLGMDSLNMMDFLVLLERKYQVRISDEKLGDVDTIGDVVKLVNELRSTGGEPKVVSR